MALQQYSAAVHMQSVKTPARGEQIRRFRIGWWYHTKEAHAVWLGAARQATQANSGVAGQWVRPLLAHAHVQPRTQAFQHLAESMPACIRHSVTHLTGMVCERYTGSSSDGMEFSGGGLSPTEDEGAAISGRHDWHMWDQAQPNLVTATRPGRSVSIAACTHDAQASVRWEGDSSNACDVCVCVRVCHEVQ